MNLRSTLERLWLRALPSLTSDYLWISVDGMRLYGSRQHSLILYWLMKGSYERYTRKLFRRSLRPGSRVIDIGAHIGYYTLLAAREVGAAGHVYSFECDPSNLRFLRHNVALNGMSDAVTVIPKAVAESAGVRPFFPDPNNSLISSLWENAHAVPPTRVECTTVDDSIKNSESVDIVKIDVEGGEFHVLKGMTQMLAGCERLIMFVECNPSALHLAGASAADLIGKLHEFNMHVQVIDEKRRCLSPLTTELTAPELADGKYYTNLYCTKGLAPKLLDAEAEREAANLSAARSR